MQPSLSPAGLNPAEFLILLIIAAIAVLPVAAYRPTRGLVPGYLGLIAVFAFIQYRFISGAVGAGHDTANTYQALYLLIAQWMQQGLALGWNPYIGGGQPLGLFNNYIMNPQLFLVRALYALLDVRVDNTVFFNLVWLSYHLTVATGSVLFFSRLSARPAAVLIGVSLLLFGGLFFADLIAPSGLFLLMYLPYFLFLLDLGRTRGGWWCWPLLGILTGAALNLYIPHFIALTVAIYVTALAAAQISAARSVRPLLRQVAAVRATMRRYHAWLWSVVLLFATASPFIYAFAMSRNYLSPTRGFTPQGAMNAQGGEGQPAVSIPASAYRLLVDRAPDYANALTSHMPLYVGVAGVVLAGLGVAGGRRAIPVVVTIAVLCLLSLGDNGLLWWLLTEYVPTADFMRHPFHFTRAVHFFLIVLAVLGVDAVLSRRVGLPLAILSSVLIAMGAFYLVSRGGGRLPIALAVGVVLAIAGCVWLAELRQVGFAAGGRMAGALLLAAVLFDVTSFSVTAQQMLRPARAPAQAEFRYPDRWTSLTRAGRLPFDLEGMFAKESLWLSNDPDGMFLLHKDFVRIARENFQCGGRHFCRPLSGPIFFTIPAGQSADDYLQQRGFDIELKQSGSPFPRMQLVNVTGDTGGSAQNAIDGDVRTEWVPSSRRHGQNIWLHFATAGPVSACSLVLWPRRNHSGPLWADASASLHFSNDEGQSWQIVRKLDIASFGYTEDDRPFQMPLWGCGKGNHFALAFEDSAFAGLAEIGLVPLQPDYRATSPSVPITAIKASSSMAEHLPQAVTDGNQDTFWHVAMPRASTRHFLRLDVPEGSTVCGLRISPRRGHANQLWRGAAATLETTLDGNQWNAVKTLNLDDGSGTASGLPAIFLFPECLFNAHYRVKIEDRYFHAIGDIDVLGVKEGESGVFVMPSQSPNQVEISVFAGTPQRLVRLENHHPGWSVTVNGVKRDLQRTTGGIQYIDLASGHHRIVFNYHDLYGSLLTVFGLCFGFGWLGWLLALFRASPRAGRGSRAASSSGD